MTEKIAMTWKNETNGKKGTFGKNATFEKNETNGKKGSFEREFYLRIQKKGTLY